MRIGIICALLIAGLVSRSVVAAESLEALVESGQYQAAYDLALTQEIEQAGEPKFDFLFGLAALEAGHPQQAVFALERVLQIIPQDHRARLELGRAYFVLGNFEKSEELFKTVMAADPPERVKENIQAFLDQISGRSKTRDRQLSNYVQLKLGYDTNINSATTVDNITLPIGLVLTLGETSQELGDEYAELDAGVSFLKLLRKDMGYFISASLSEHQNSQYNQFDTRLIGLGGGYVYQAHGQSFRVPLQYQYLQVAQNHFRTSTGLGFEWSLVPSKQVQYVFFSQYAQQRHTPSEKIRDVDLALLGFGVSSEITQINFTLSLSAYSASESSKQTGGDHFGRGYSGLRLMGSWKPHHQHELQLGGSAQKVKHDAIHPAFGLVRDDSYSQFSLDWIWRFNPQWRFNVGLSHITNSSNITIYTYKRSQQFLGLRYSF